MIHYELIIIYSMGFTPSEVINRYGYARGTAYRFNRIYRHARQRAKNIVCGDLSVSPGERKKENKVDQLDRKKYVPQVDTMEGWVPTLETGQ